MKTLAWFTLSGLLSFFTCSTFAQDTSRVLKIYNWSDYIDENVLTLFEQETGIDVTYDTFESNTEVEEKIVAGGKGYDIVVPSLDFMAKQLRNGFFQRIDQTQLTNYANLDPAFLARVARLDIENAHGIPYMWGTTGIGYNREKVLALLGDKAPVDSWELVFDPDNLSKLAQCGVSIVDEPTELYSIVLNYLGKDPNSEVTDDYRQATKDVLGKLTDYITYFDSADHIERLANGEICIAVGWSGDIYQAMALAEEQETQQDIVYVIPEEGTAQWVDMLAIPELAKNVTEAHEFINFLLRPDIAAANTNYVWYPNAVTASSPLIEDDIISDTAIYPTPAIQAKLFTKSRRKVRVRHAIENEWENLLEQHSKQP